MSDSPGTGVVDKWISDRMDEIYKQQDLLSFIREYYKYELLLDTYWISTYPGKRSLFNISQLSEAQAILFYSHSVKEFLPVVLAIIHSFKTAVNDQLILDLATLPSGQVEYILEYIGENHSSLQERLEHAIRLHESLTGLLLMLENVKEIDSEQD